jgi:hypothetical protein
MAGTFTGYHANGAAFACSFWANSLAWSSLILCCKNREICLPVCKEFTNCCALLTSK